MDLRLPQFLLLLMLVSCERTEDQPMPSTCEFMLLEKKVYQRWCVGTYPFSVRSKYQDRLIDVGEPYALYLPLSQDSIMVLHKRSPLMSCRNLMFKDSKTFFCVDRDINRTLSVRQASLYCLSFHMRLPDDLMHECLKQNDFQHSDKYLEEVLRTRRCVLHYTLGEGAAQSSSVSTLLPFLALLLQLF